MAQETISKQQALEDICLMIRRTALLHYCYAKTLIEEFGQERGKELILKSIHAYGEKVGNKMREEVLAKGLELVAQNYQGDLPSLGWEGEVVTVEGERRARVHLCRLAELWKELEAPEIGRLYCFVDQAKYEAYNPELECVHTRNVLDGDPHCEIAVRAKKKEGR